MIDDGKYTSGEVEEATGICGETKNEISPRLGRIKNLPLAARSFHTQIGGTSMATSEAQLLPSPFTIGAAADTLDGGKTENTRQQPTRRAWQSLLRRWWWLATPCVLHTLEAWAYAAGGPRGAVAHPEFSEICILLLLYCWPAQFRRSLLHSLESIICKNLRLIVDLGFDPWCCGCAAQSLPLGWWRYVV
jgi:hypothetical protein